MHPANQMCTPVRVYDKKDSDICRFRGSAAWKKARTYVRNRDLNLCALCRARGVYTTNGLSVHHITPLDGGGSRVDPSNLITLCSACHGLAERGNISRDELRALIPRD